MTDDKKKWSLSTPPPILDKSKWAKVPLAKPIDPRDVIEAARAIRANPELWAIFERLKPDDWIADDDALRISKFYKEHFAALGRGSDVYLRGQELALLRDLAEGRLASLEADDELIRYWKQKRPSGI